MANAKFHLNYENEYFIDTTPDAEQPTWAQLAPGITTVTPATNDETDDTGYYDGEGFGSTNVIGIKPSWALSGHRKVGDAAQDFIAGTAYDITKRGTRFKWVNTSAGELVFPVTIVNPVVTGGDAKAKETFSAELHATGKPITD